MPFIFIVNLNICGFANFEVIIQSPNGSKMPYKIDNNFTKKIRFIPAEIGTHKVTMKLGNCLLTGNLYISISIHLCFSRVEHKNL